MGLTELNKIRLLLEIQSDQGLYCLPFCMHLLETFLYCSNVHAYMSYVIRKSAFCICEKKGADQLPGNCAADQRIYFCYTDSTIPPLPKSKISSF